MTFGMLFEVKMNEKLFTLKMIKSFLTQKIHVTRQFCSQCKRTVDGLKMLLRGALPRKKCLRQVYACLR